MTHGPDAASAAPGRGGRRLGVLGTLVRDRIRLAGARSWVEGWGGIAYSLSAFDAVLHAEWTVVPIVRIGRDLAEEGAAYLDSFARVGDLGWVRRSAEANNRVDLVYTDSADRTERLRGGVRGWTADEIEEATTGLDALYVNFVSGREMDLEGALLARTCVAGPSYADLHSLFLGAADDGRRRPRYLPSATRWAACFDSVQMNGDEFALFAAGEGDAWLQRLRGPNARVRLVVVTRGREGVDLTALKPDGRVARSRMAPAAVAAAGDPTGCGDVLGAAFFAGLLSGVGARPAMDRAQALAGANLEVQGAERCPEAFRRVARPRGEATRR